MSNVENVSTKGTKRAPQSRPADLIGRPWANEATLKAGDYVKTDDGFTCMREGEVKEVHANTEGELFVCCADGEHHLCGQLGYTPETKGAYVGLYPATKP